MHGKPDNRDRRLWRLARGLLEHRLWRENHRSSVNGERRQKATPGYPVLRSLLVLSRLYAIGERNARAFRVRRLDFSFADLPAAFDGYAILHLSDLHVGQPAGLLAAAAGRLSGLGPDLVVMTGDYQSRGRPPAGDAAKEVCRLLDAVGGGGDGRLAVLGNHDSGDMVAALEDRGVRMLVNESVLIRRAGDRLRFVGLDDVHSFFTGQAPATLDKYRDGFRIALVHTVELAGRAANAGYSLYLSGHSHGGQVCLPGGRPLITSLDSHRRLAAGRWRLRQMQGYTNRGLGAQLPPVRFNCPGEAVMIRLWRRPGH